MAGTKKPTAVKVLQGIYYILGAFYLIGVFGLTTSGGVTPDLYRPPLGLWTIVAIVTGVGFISAGAGMGQRAQWSFWVALGTLGVNLVFSIYPVVSVLAIGITLVLAYFTWKQKVYLMGGGATKA